MPVIPLNYSDNNNLWLVFCRIIVDMCYISSGSGAAEEDRPVSKRHCCAREPEGLRADITPRQCLTPRHCSERVITELVGQLWRHRLFVVTSVCNDEDVFFHLLDKLKLEVGIGFLIIFRPLIHASSI